MSHDTQVKRETPERIWIDLRDGDDEPLPFVYQRMPIHTRPAENCFEYVHADLLATVRRETLKEVRTAIDNMDVVITRFQKRSSDYNGWNSAIKQAHKAIAALESTANTNPVDEPRAHILKEPG